MDTIKRNLAIVGLKESDLDLIPAMVKDDRWEVVSIADEDASAAALRIAEIMRLPATTNIASLTSLDVDVVLCGSEEAKRMVNQILGGGVGTMRPDEATGRVPEDKTPEPGALELGAEESLALGTLADTLSLALDRQKLLRWILDLAIRCTGADSGSIMLLDEKGRELRIAMAQGLSGDTVRTTRQRLGEGIAGKVALEGRPLLISGEAEIDQQRGGKERSDVKAAMCVPLMAKGRAIGVLNVGSSKDPSVFQGRDLHLLEKLAERVTEVIHKAVEYSTIANKALELTLREAAEEELMKEVPLDEKVRLLADSLGRELEADCYIYLPDKERSGRSILFASSTKDAEPLLPRVVVDGKGFLGRAASSGKSRVLLPGSIVSPILGGEDLGILCVPLGAQHKQGLLVFDSIKVSEVELEAFLSAFERVGRYMAKELGREISLLGLREQASVLAELNQVASSLMTTHKIEEVVRIVASEGVRLFKADVSLIACEDGRTWFVDGLRGTEGVEEEDGLGRARQLLAAESLKEMSFISSEDADETLCLEVERLGISSFLVGPLRAGGKFLGVSILLRMKEGKKEAFGEGEGNLFKSFCGYAAHGLQRVLISMQAEQFTEGDSETGLLGAQAVLKKIDDEAKRYERYGIGFCITVAEVEGLTAAFQRLGDEWRSAFLEEFCGGLRKSVREVDTIGRTGEATFVVVSPQTPRDGNVILERIEVLLARIGAVRYVSPAPELSLKGLQLYWPKDVSDLKKAHQLISVSLS
ncbi:MAG: GAF domain-containing protein [Candidatus Eisenbacteria bacterium]|nr:GAF domain-containing protein [Candidatus Eisenbacteria bacterium]